MTSQAQQDHPTHPEALLPGLLTSQKFSCMALTATFFRSGAIVSRWKYGMGWTSSISTILRAIGDMDIDNYFTFTLQVLPHIHVNNVTAVIWHISLGSPLACGAMDAAHRSAHCSTPHQIKTLSDQSCQAVLADVMRRLLTCSKWLCLDVSSEVAQLAVISCAGCHVNCQHVRDGFLLLSLRFI